MSGDTGWRPDGCIECNAHPADIIDITEYGDDDRRWCCGRCDAIWKEAPVKDGRLYVVIAEGYLP